MQNISKYIFLIAILLAISSFFFNHIFAQNHSLLNITVSPVYFDYRYKAGDTIKDKIRLRNNTAAPMDLAIKINKLAADGNGDLTIQDRAQQDEFLSWITVEKEQFTAPSSEWITIPFTIQIPQHAAYGYYMAISITEAQKKSDGNTVAVTGQAVIPILLTVQKPGAKSEATLIEFKAKQYINQYMPIEFISKIKNTGNLHIRPSGNIFISGPGNKDLALLDVNQNFASILPSVVKTFKNQWSDGFFVYEDVYKDGDIETDKEGKPVKKLTVHWNKLTNFRFGRYTAHLFLVFDDGKRDVTIESTTTFWVIPYMFISILVILFTGSFIGIRNLLTLRDQKVIEKYLKRKTRL